ncbi:MAG: DMT family transporter [Thermomicrobiales bacterium]
MLAALDVALVRRPAYLTLAPLALIAANVIWGGSAVATKAALDHVPPLTLACIRLAIAYAVLRPLVARIGERPTRGPDSMLLGLTGVALFCLLQNVGLRYASAANTALINGAIPIMTAGLATLTLKERLNSRQCVGFLVSLAGVTTIVLVGQDATLRASVLANLLPLASALSFAVYAVLGRRVFGERNALAIVTGSTRYGLLFLLPAAGLELALLGVAALTLHDALLLLYLGIGCSGLAFVLWGYGLTHYRASQGAVFGNLKPLAGSSWLSACLGSRSPPVKSPAAPSS